MHMIRTVAAHLLDTEKKKKELLGSSGALITFAPCYGFYTE